MATYLLLAAFLVACAPIVSILAIRRNVRRRRQMLLDQTTATFGLDGDASFEFVKYKYDGVGRAGPTWGQRLGVIGHWSAAAAPLLATNFALALFAFAEIAQSRFGVDEAVDRFVLSPPQPFRWVIVTGFCAAFLNMCADLLRAVRNFDLSPLSFLDAAINILLGIFVGLVFYFAFDIFNADLLPNAFAQAAGGTKLPFAIIVAFVASYYPDAVKRYIVRVSHFNYIKVEKTATFNGLKLIPVEVIDGVDSTIRKRLEDYHIYCVENLAVANPVMLYVETPYGLYARVDWVGQAQLFSAFGVKKAAALLDLGVRTLLDLEAYAAAPAQHQAILKAMGDVLLKGAISPDGNDPTAPVVGCIHAALAALHVRRLKQLVNLLRVKVDT